MDEILFGLSFAVFLSAIFSVALSLNAWLYKAFDKNMDNGSTMLVALSIFSLTFIFSRTAYFANVFDIIAPHQSIEPAYWTRMVSLSALFFAECIVIRFLLMGLQKPFVWRSLVAGIIALSFASYVFAPRFI